MTAYRKNDIVSHPGYSVYYFRLIEKLEEKEYGPGVWLTEVLNKDFSIAVNSAYNEPTPKTEQHRKHSAYHAMHESRFSIIRKREPITYQEFIGE